jgi:hypothetical protein
MPADATGRDLQVLAEGLGLQTFAYRGSMDDLQENLRKGRPLIVMIPQPQLPTGELTAALLLNAWNQWGPRPAHWVVVVGFTKNKAVIIHDPDSGAARHEAGSLSGVVGEKGRPQRADCRAVIVPGRAPPRRWPARRAENPSPG